MNAEYQFASHDPPHEIDLRSPFLMANLIWYAWDEDWDAKMLNGLKNL